LDIERIRDQGGELGQLVVKRFRAGPGAPPLEVEQPALQQVHDLIFENT